MKPPHDSTTPQRMPPYRMNPRTSKPARHLRPAAIATTATLAAALLSGCAEYRMNPRTSQPARHLRPAAIATTVTIAALAAALLSSCAEYPIFDKAAPRNASHPKATSVTERDSGARAAPARPRERDRDRDDAPRDGGGLREGIRLYNEGDFNGAIKRLSARDLNNGPLATRLSALKYTAFSYCVTSRPVQCRQAFDRALRLDPSFDLAPGEHGHPLWGPVFTKAKQAAG
jgi:hypothetical protein